MYCLFYTQIILCYLVKVVSVLYAYVMRNMFLRLWRAKFS